MTAIRLHTPTSLNDTETTTEFEAENILNLRSVLGDDNTQGTKFSVLGVSDEQFCVESVVEVKALIKRSNSRWKLLWRWVTLIAFFALTCFVAVCENWIAAKTQNSFDVFWNWAKNLIQ